MAEMDQSLQSQIDTYLAHLDGLMGRGQQLSEMLDADAGDASVMAQTRRWQEDCGQIINQLSGGSKAHWLARAFSQAFLMRTAEGQAMQGAAPSDIVRQLMAVLGQAVSTLTHTTDAAIASATAESPAPRRFEFVHNAEIRPVLESAYSDARAAVDKGDFQLALVTYCGILEAIVTDALESRGQPAMIALGAPAEKISDWPFETRLAIAEKAGLIRGGWVRLPASARTYRDHMDRPGDGIPEGATSEGDAKRAGQVLHVIMRDLNPSR